MISLKISGSHQAVTNIQYDVFEYTKEVLKDFCPNQEDKLQYHLRGIPFKVRAITCKNYLLKIYSQHANFLNAI